MNPGNPQGKAHRNKVEFRDRILAAASMLFIEKGARSVSMDEVAVAAGVARRTLFNYFAGKDDLLWTIASPMLEEASALAEARLATGPAGLKGRGLDVVIDLCLELWRSWGRSLSLLYSVDLAGEDRLAELHGSFLSRFQRLVALAISEEPSLQAQPRLAGRVIYRVFVPLLLALDGVSPVGVAFPREGPAGASETDVPAQGSAMAGGDARLEAKFAAGMRGILAGVVGED